MGYYLLMLSELNKIQRQYKILLSLVFLVFFNFSDTSLTTREAKILEAKMPHYSQTLRQDQNKHMKETQSDLAGEAFVNTPRAQS